jgi:hypothetical protein
MGWMVNATPRPLYLRETDPVPTVQEAGLAPGAVGTFAEKFAPTGIRSPDLPARSEWLHRLNYSGPYKLLLIRLIICTLNVEVI